MDPVTDLHRRRFLRLAAQGTAALAMGLLPRRSAAQPVCQPPAQAGRRWGDLPPEFDGTPFACGYKVLDIHLLGGASPWKAFYWRPSDGSRSRGFDEAITAYYGPGGAWGDVPVGLGCGADLEPDALSHPFSTDSAGQTVHLGPFALPFHGRDDLLGRMRLLVMRHDQVPHETAIPLTLTGLRLGNPRQASPGAPIQRHDRERHGTDRRPSCFAFVGSHRLQLDVGKDIARRHLQQLGAHPGFARPIALDLSDAGSSTSFLDRDPAQAARRDALLRHYLAEYRARVVPAGQADPTRSLALDDYAATLAQLQHADALVEDLEVPGVFPTFCRASITEDHLGSPGAAGIRAGARLLSRAEDPARWVMVVDAGKSAPLLAPAYDTHALNGPHLEMTSENYHAVLSAIGDAVSAGELDLDDTLVVIHTEFGRTPFRSGVDAPNPASRGRDHWPDAYAAVLIGGPVTPAAADAPDRVVGAIGDGTPVSLGGPEGRPHEIGGELQALGPADLRAAVLLAAGVHPFEPENLALGDLSPRLNPSGGAGAQAHLAAMQALREVVFGG